MNPISRKRQRTPPKRSWRTLTSAATFPNLRELSSAFVLLGGTLVVAVMVGPAMVDLSALLAGLMEQAAVIPLDGGSVMELTGELGPMLAMAVAIPFLFLMAMAVLGNLVQHKLVFSVDPITPKLSKISPISGFKRLFSVRKA